MALWIIQDPGTYGLRKVFGRFQETRFGMSLQVLDNRFDNRLKWLCGACRIPEPMVCATFSIGFKNPDFACRFWLLIIALIIDSSGSVDHSVSRNLWFAQGF